MTETKTIAPIIPTLEIVKAEINLSLNQNRFQLIQNTVNNLVFNEDNLTEIAGVLKAGRELKKVVADKHKAGKEPFLQGGKLWDEGKRAAETLLDGIFNPVETKYTRLCQEVEKRRQEQLLETQRKQKITEGINTNLIVFSGQIAAAETLEEITKIESRINLEINSANAKNKYQEFLEEAKLKYQSLTAQIKNQKDKVKQLLEIKAQEAEALKKDDDETLIALAEKKEAITATIEENKTEVQQQAINVATEANIISVEPILNAPKVRRQSWKWEIIDIEKEQKHLPAYMVAIPNKDFLDAELDKFKKDLPKNSTLEEHIPFKNVRFFLDKQF